MIFPIKQASYFGSYTDGLQTDSSDLDLLVEFKRTTVSLLTIIAVKNDLEDLLQIPVDVVHAPLSKESLITIGKVVRVYG